MTRRRPINDRRSCGTQANGRTRRWLESRRREGEEERVDARSTMRGGGGEEGAEEETAP